MPVLKLATGDAGSVRVDVETVGAFTRLRYLLSGVELPLGVEPIDSALGESRFHPPEHLLAGLHSRHYWYRYPPLGGTSPLKTAYQGWLQRRFGVSGDAAVGDADCEPTPGSKQAVAGLIQIAVGRARARGVDHPIVVIPNPYYPTYLSATLFSGAQPVFLPRSTQGVAASLSGIGRDLSDVAAVIVCSPSNPEGVCTPPDDYRELVLLTRQVGALLVVDECYIDLFLDHSPTSIIRAAHQGPRHLQGIVVVHTLSKRSGVPGLRSGFVYGDRGAVGEYARFNRSCGVSASFGACEAAASLWSDDLHVEAHRAAIRENWRLADHYLKDVPGYRRAEAGFFVWLPVEDDEAQSVRLWSSVAVKVMPGRYLASPDLQGQNPGEGYLRIALVHTPDIMRTALARLRRCLMPHT